MRTLLRVGISPVWCVITLACLTAFGCSGSDPDPYQPLSEACDACLLRADEDGCGDAYDACEALDECEPIVLCELGQQCYAEASDGDCSRKAGCESGADEEELASSEEFEECARSVCADVCDFVE